jgi:hypothetical protein
LHLKGLVIVSSIHRVILVSLFLIAVSTFGFAQFPIPTQRPSEDNTGAQVRQLVSNYCRLDYEGSRLDPKMWPKFQPLVWWTSAPEISKVNVVARYTVDSEPTEDHGKYSVTVHYRLLGTFDPNLGYLPEPEGSTQDVYYSVTQQNSDWRIADSDNTLPHPSRNAMLKWLTQQAGSAQDQALKARYQAAIDKLQQQSASPFAR